MRINPEIVLRGDRNECPSCGRPFRSSSAFDKHRIGYFSEPSKRILLPRRCMTEEEMLAAGMGINKRGFWVGSFFEEGHEFGEKEEETA